MHRKNMNASTGPIGILQPEFWWWGHVTNLPGFDWLQLSGLRIAFYNDIPDLQRYDGGVTHSRFWIFFSDNHLISIRPQLNSLLSDIDLVSHPSQMDDQRSERVPKTAVL